MRTVEKIAIRKPNGVVVTAPIGKSHADIGVRGQHGFIVGGKFTGRDEAARVAAKSGQLKRNGVKHLHSHQVKKASRP